MRLPRQRRQLIPRPFHRSGLGQHTPFDLGHLVAADHARAWKPPEHLTRLGQRQFACNLLRRSARLLERTLINARRLAGKKKAQPFQLGPSIARGARQNERGGHSPMSR